MSGVKLKKDELGARMKDNYESRSQTHLPRRTYTVMRLDGKAFHTYTKGFKRPYDEGLMRIMDKTAVKLCESIQGAKMAYVQSDEISVVITDFDDIKTDAWFDANVQKMCSISASIATAAFNNGMYLDDDILANMSKVAYFDSRVFTIPSREEVLNYLIWRQQDATRNSIQMGAQALYSHKQLHGKNTSELQEMMFQKGVNWDKYPVGFKRGRIILKEKIEKVVVVDVETGGTGNDLIIKPEVHVEEKEYVNRNKWASFDPPIFTQDREFILNRLPKVD